MRYALLIYDEPGTYEALSDADRDAAMGEFFALTQEDAFVHGAQLQPVETATTVRVQQDRTLTTDGPFAETREVFGGYYVIDVQDLDEALAFAARIPSARLGGSVEVRPLVER